jgi:hypothetical protein
LDLRRGSIDARLSPGNPPAAANSRPRKIKTAGGRSDSAAGNVRRISRPSRASKSRRAASSKPHPALGREKAGFAAGWGLRYWPRRLIGASNALKGVGRCERTVDSRRKRQVLRSRTQNFPRKSPIRTALPTPFAKWVSPNRHRRFGRVCARRRLSKL